ncbi:hypothetical protein [Autumnicola edwardsiae]|uniref:Uncharacterized protein n=1 Tax=Autumnicola edwardsiae TaxID=3075594 RepID=A0ABU3CRB4_9FLAO|nr:hypothetical protein [Zunongwangia sp. F297]MDT0648894.1 hypothetical protein [Zunongwangia sp. F297]
MEEPAEKRNKSNSNPERDSENNFREERASRRSAASKKKIDKTSYRKHKNPVIRALSKTGYTVWIVVMAIGLLMAFIVSVALL